jgi:phosphoglycolate phosphatase-like HAD superfamily hydrolase
LRRFGHRVPAARIRREVGKGGQELLREFAGATERHFLGGALGAVQVELFLESPPRAMRPFPGAAATVRAMRRSGLTVVIASSADRRVIEKALRRLGLSGDIDGFTSADDVANAKPFDDIFSISIARFRLGSRHPVAIGDTPYDIAAAHQIGIPCLAVSSGGFSDRLLAGADGRFDDLADLWRRGRDFFR